MASDADLLAQFNEKVDKEKQTIVQNKLIPESVSVAYSKEEEWKLFLKDTAEKPLEIEHLCHRYNFPKLFVIIPPEKPEDNPRLFWELPKLDWPLDEFPCFAFKINLLFLQWVSDQVSNFGILSLQIAVQEHCIAIFQWFFDRFLPEASQELKKQWVKDMAQVQKSGSSKKKGETTKTKSSQALEKKKQKRAIKIAAKIEKQKQKLTEKYGSQQHLSAELEKVLQHPDELLQLIRFETNCDQITQYSKRFEPLFQREALKISSLSHQSFMNIFHTASSMEEAQTKVKTILSNACFDK